MSSPRLSRRDWLKLSAAGVLGSSVSGWFEGFANAAAANPARKRSCILWWMNGGPSQMDTFDLKPGHKNGGPYKEIATAVPGIKISEHLPKVAAQFKRLSIIRSMTTKEADHGRATFLMRTGYMPTGPIQYPALGGLVSREIGRDDAALQAEDGELLKGKAGMTSNIPARFQDFRVDASDAVGGAIARRIAARDAGSRLRSCSRRSRRPC